MSAQPYSDVPVDAAGGIAIAMRCRTCGYNLRSQPLTGVCPECGTPVYETARTFRADDLVYADPNWLDKVLLGARLLVAAILISVGTSIFGGFLGLFLGVSGAPPTGILIMQWVLNLIVMALWIAGLLLLTRRSPHAAEKGISARRAVRQLLLLLTAVWIGGIVAATMLAIQAFSNVSQLSPFPQAYFTATMLLAMAGMLVGAMLLAALLRHIRNLMIAAGAAGAARFATFMFWLQWPITLAIVGGLMAIWLPLSGLFSTPFATTTTTAPRSIILPANIPTNGVYTVTQMGPTQLTYYSFVPPAGGGAQFAPGTAVTITDTSGQTSMPPVSVSVTAGTSAAGGKNNSQTTPVIATPVTQSAPTGGSSTPVTFTTSITPGGQGNLAGVPGAVSMIVDATTSPTVATAGLLIGSVFVGVGVLAALGFAIGAMILIFITTGKLSSAAREARANWLENGGATVTARPVGM